MPLLHRSPFVRQSPPTGLQPNDEVFFCKLTGEIFDDYEKFFERIILCNSLVWTCTLTGRVNLTYQEALHSEKRAQEQLNSFASSLQSPIIYLAHLTHRSRFSDVVDDVYSFSKDRYFIGETVAVENSDGSVSGKIVQVIPPSINKTTKTECKRDDSDSDVICLDDEDDFQPPSKKIKLSDSQEKGEENRQMFGTDPLLFRYVVQDPKSKDLVTADAKNICRKKGVFNREKCKLFLKQHCSAEEDGIWKVKAKFASKFQLSTLAFSDFFAGPLPSFEVSEAKKKRAAVKITSDNELQAKAGVIDLTEDDVIHPGSKPSQQKGKKKQEKKPTEPRGDSEKKNRQNAEQVNIDEEFQRMRQEIAERAQKREQERLERQKAKEMKKEELKRKADENRQKRKEELEKKKLERKQQDALMREWNRPREDLECEDLKALPTPTPVSCPILSGCFGDAVMVLEYLLSFQTVFEFNLPRNITIEVLAKALNDVDIDGLYADIVRELLTTIFRLQDDEDREEATDGKDIKGLLEGLEEFEDKIFKDLIRSATLASQWPVVNYGTPLRKLQVDSYTLTEIVRLHLLSSGSLSKVHGKYDYQQRGGYTSRDDPALVFCQQETTILNLLGKGNIFDLSCSDKLKLVTVLIHQLLTFVLSRDVIDENCERLKQIQRNLRQLLLTEQKRDKDEMHYRWKKKLEERQQQELGTNPTDECMILESSVEENGKKSSGNQKKTAGLVPDTDYDDVVTENIDWDKITPEERARMKERFEKKEKELQDLATELQLTHSISPLGRDRTFRRFWVFRSIPGLFVEDDEAHVPTDFFQSSSQKLAAKRVAEDCNDDVSESEKSDKENFPVALDDESIVTTSINETANGLCDEDSTVSYVANSSVNPVTKVKWAFYGSSDEIDRLIDALNPRGLREGALRTALLEQKDQLKEWLDKSNFKVLQNVDNEFDGNAQDKRIRPRGKQLPSVLKYDSAQENLENNLRDMLLDIEERIFVGSLGNLKVKDRMEWRAAIDRGRFNARTDAVMAAKKPICTNGPSSDGQQIEEPIDSDKSATEKSSIVVKDLAKALLQVEQMIEPRYLEPPLGKEAVKKGKQKVIVDAALRSLKRDLDSRRDSPFDSDEDDRSSASSQRKTALERWEESLISSNSLAQIFLHLTVLESSVTWSKSALHARCRICRRKGDGERMLLCDGCDRGHHMYCLKPPVKHIPAGDWFCPTCRPKDVPHTPRKKAKFSDEDASGDEERESSDSSEDDGNSARSEESSDEGETADDGDEVEGDSNSEEEEDEENETEDDDDDGEDHSDSEIVIKPSAKIKFVKTTSCSRKNLQVQKAASSVNQMKTRLRTSAVNSNASSSQDASPAFETNRKSESINGHSKYGFYQTDFSLDSGTKAAASGSKSHPKRFSLGTEALRVDAGDVRLSGGSKRSRRSLEDELSSSDTTVDSKRSRTGKDMRVRRSTRSLAAGRSNEFGFNVESGTDLQTNLNESSTDDSEERNTFTTKSRDKEQLSTMKTCEDLVNELMQRVEAWPFLKPVTRREAPDYFDIIKKPMDLSVIRNKVKRLEYLRPSEVLDDVRLIFSNCKEYNMPTAPEFAAGQKLESYFEKRLRELKLKSVSTSPGSKSRGSEDRFSPKKLRKRTL